MDVNKMRWVSPFALLVLGALTALVVGFCTGCSGTATEQEEMIEGQAAVQKYLDTSCVFVQRGGVCFIGCKPKLTSIQLRPVPMQACQTEHATRAQPSPAIALEELETPRDPQAHGRVPESYSAHLPRGW